MEGRDSNSAEEIGGSVSCGKIKGCGPLGSPVVPGFVTEFVTGLLHKVEPAVINACPPATAVGLSFVLPEIRTPDYCVRRTNGLKDGTGGDGRGSCSAVVARNACRPGNAGPAMLARAR